MANKLFDWTKIDVVYLKRLLGDPYLSAEGVAKKLAPKVGDQPTRSALLGFVARRSDLQEIWAMSRRRPVKKVAPGVQKKRPRIAAVDGKVIAPVVEPTVEIDVVVQVPPPKVRRIERRVPLVDLRLNECKFPVDEKDAAEVVGRFLFCGAPVAVAGRVYCQHHVGVAFNPNRGRQLPKTYVKAEPQPKRTPLRLSKRA